MNDQTAKDEIEFAYVSNEEAEQEKIILEVLDRLDNDQKTDIKYRREQRQEIKLRHLLDMLDAADIFELHKDICK